MKPDPRAARRRREEFDALYERHGREVWAVAYGRRADPDLAADITHEAFLRLWREWAAGETIVNPRAWLFRVARNLAEDEAKSAFRRNGTLPTDQLGGLTAEDRSPLDTLERDEVFAQIRAMLDELPAQDREILTLRYALDYDAATIADLLAVNATAVHMRLSRARQRLAERLTALGVQTPP